MNKISAIKAQAQKHLSSGNYDKALEEYEKLLALEDVDPYDYVLAGDVHLKKGDKSGAVSLYQKSVDAYEKLGLYKNAAAIGKRALRLDPGLSEMYKQLGRIRLREGLTTEALQDLNTYYEIKMREGDVEKAIAGLELACKACPQDVELCEKLCSLYEQTQRNEEAAKELSRISNVLRNGGDEDGATKYHERALRLSPEVVSRSNRADEMWRSESVHEPALEHGASPLPAPAGAPGEPQTVAKQPPGAPTGTDHSSVVSPDETGAGSLSIKEKGRAKISEVNIGQILKQFKAQMESKVGPDDHQCHYDLGVTFKEMGLYEEALNEFRMASASDDFRVKSFEMTGLCHLEIGEYEEALEAFNRAIRQRSKSDPDYAGLCFDVGVSLRALGRTEEALKSFLEVASLNPEFPGLKNALETLRSKAEGGQ